MQFTFVKRNRFNKTKQTTKQWLPSSLPMMKHYKFPNLTRICHLLNIKIDIFQWKGQTAPSLYQSLLKIFISYYKVNWYIASGHTTTAPSLYQSLLKIFISYYKVNWYIASGHTTTAPPWRFKRHYWVMKQTSLTMCQMVLPPNYASTITNIDTSERLNQQQLLVKVIWCYSPSYLINGLSLFMYILYNL